MTRHRPPVAAAFAAALVVTVLAGAAAAQHGVFVVTTDYTTGSTALLPAGATEAQINLLGVHADAVGRYQAGRIYVINRLGADNVLVLDPADPSTPVTQFSVGNGSNPQDIEVVAADRAYVSRYDSAELLVVDPTDGTELGTVDLSAYADADGWPEMSEMVRVGDRLYVACQRLDRDNGFVPLDGVVVVIDLATDTVVDAIDLAADNPNSLIAFGDRIAVAGTSAFGDRAGGVEILDTASGTSRGIVISEADLGGDLGLLALQTSTRGFAVVTDESFVNSVVPVNLVTGQVGAPLEGLSGGYIASLAVDGDRLLVGDQGSFSDPASAGLKIYDAASGALLAGPIDTGLPPASLVVLDDAPITAVIELAGDTVPRDAHLGLAYPNPFNSTVRIPFDLAATGAATELAVFDLLGRRVRTLASGLAPGRYAVTWDGRDDAGRPAGSGAYLVRLTTHGHRAATRVTLLK